MKPHALRCLIVVVILLSAAGCRDRGPAIGAVQGIVTFQGRPVREGFVIFENTAKGWTRSAKLENDGSYRHREVPVAEYVVRVVPPEPTLPDENHRPRDGHIARPAPDAKDIPPAVRDSQSTPLRATVAKGANQLDFELAR
jgi:hypothetical protein